MRVLSGGMSDDETRLKQALEKVERARKERGTSVREATRRTLHISEGYWRQLVAGGVRQSGVWVPKVPTLEQVLKMAAAVGIAEEIAADLGAEAPDSPGVTTVDREELLELRAALVAALERIDQIQRQTG